MYFLTTILYACAGRMYVHSLSHVSKTSVSSDPPFQHEWYCGLEGRKVNFPQVNPNAIIERYMNLGLDPHLLNITKNSRQLALEF